MAVTETPVAEHAPMTATDAKFLVDRGATAIEASTPKHQDLYVTLLDRVVHVMAADGLPPTAALATAGRVIRDTPWAAYRNGRGRLGSSAASYFTWLAPPADWAAVDVPTVGDRWPVGWTSPAGEVVVDLLFSVSRLPRDLVPGVKEAVPSYAAIRLLNLAAPTHSVAYLPTGPARALVETPWWFEGGVR